MKHKLLGLAIALLVPMTALAQTTGIVAGKVVDEDGKAVSGAVIKIMGTKQGTLSKTDGSFLISGIRAGDYEVEISSIGTEKVTKQVRVSVNQTTELGAIKLLPLGAGGGGPSTGVVTVIGKNDKLIQPNRVGTTRTVSREDLDITARTSIVGAVALQNSVSTAGVNGFSIRGGRANETSIRVDGVEISDPFSGGFGGSNASLYPTVSTLAVQEIQVIPSGFSAEYGDVLSGVVNSVTRSGRTDRYEGIFKFRTQVPALYGSANAITVKKPGTDIDTTLPEVKYQGSGSRLYEFAFGGPIPGTDRVTFFITGKLNTFEHTGASYEVYDMSPEFARQRAPYALQQWGLALEPTNIGQIPGQETMLRDINGKFRFNLTDDIYLELSGELGLTSRQLGDWGSLYMFDHPVLNGDTNKSILERDAQMLHQNTIINRYVARYFQSLDASSYFELNGSYVVNKAEVGKADITKKPGLLGVYDIYQPTDADGDQMIDRYEAPLAEVVLNQFLDPTRGLALLQARNPITGLYEGAELGGANMNPFGQTGGTFSTHGNSTGFDFRESTTITVKGAYETNFDLGEVKTQVKTGFDVASYTLSRHNNGLPWFANPFFDVYGEDAIYFDDSPEGQELRSYLADPYHPLEGALYVSTRFEYKSIVLQPGVRFDFMNPNTQIAPVRRGTVAQIVEGLRTAEDASMKFQVSPRVGVSYPVTDQSQFRVNFAMMFKMPDFDLLYDNAYGTAQRAGQIFGNPDIDPQKVFIYEMGYEAQIGEDYYFDVVAYYRDIYNQTGTTFIPAVPYPYSVYSVQEYGNVRGLEVTASRRLVDHVRAQLNYTLQRAVGTASSPGTNAGVTGSTDPYTGETRSIPLTEYPLSYDQTHSLNATIGLNWREGEGPSIGGINLLENTDVTFTAQYGTGLPYTRFNTKGQQIGEYNAERSPSSFDTEAHIERAFKLRGLFGDGVGNLEVSLFVDVFNVFNSTPVVGVYATTGNPDNNGTSMDRQVGDFTATAYYRELDGARPETYSAIQYDRYGQRLYSPYADSNLDGVVTQLEKYEGYQRYVSTIQSLRGNYAVPRTIAAGFKIRF